MQTGHSPAVSPNPAAANPNRAARRGKASGMAKANEVKNRPQADLSGDNKAASEVKNNAWRDKNAGTAFFKAEPLTDALRSFADRFDSLLGALNNSGVTENERAAKSLRRDAYMPVALFASGERGGPTEEQICLYEIGIAHSPNDNIYSCGRLAVNETKLAQAASARRDCIGTLFLSEEDGLLARFTKTLLPLRGKVGGDIQGSLAEFEGACADIRNLFGQTHLKGETRECSKP